MRLIEEALEPHILRAFRTAIRDPNVGDGGGGGPIASPQPDIRGNKVYVLGLRGLAGGDFRVRHAGWLCFAGQPDSLFGGDVPLSGLRSSLRQGLTVQKVKAAYAALSPLAQSHIEAAEGYNVRALRIPDLRFEAFWLKAPPFENLTVDARDLIYPIVSYLPEIPEREPVLGDRFVRTAQRLAQSQLATPRAGL